MHRLDVEVLGPKNKPKGFKIDVFLLNLIFNSFFISSKEIIFVKCLETSTIIPSPTHCPARDVPAVLGIKLVCLKKITQLKF